MLYISGALRFSGGVMNLYARLISVLSIVCQSHCVSDLRLTACYDRPFLQDASCGDYCTSQCVRPLYSGRFEGWKSYQEVRFSGDDKVFDVLSHLEQPI